MSKSPSVRDVMEPSESSPQGFHLNHNFGYGQKNLAAVLLVLNLLAFLFDTGLPLVDSTYQRRRKQRGTR